MKKNNDQALLGHHVDFQKKYQGADSIEFVDADFLPLTNFKRVAVHHLTLPPGSRSSLPHSESHEEEFFLVLKGQPDLWIDGWIHTLNPMDAVGFPAGTGINHTVINNSKENVELIVAGERSKKENKFWYPLNPEKKVSCQDHWWEEAPKKPLGPHSGLPGPVKTEEKAIERPAFIKNLEALKKISDWHYPGDNETFGIYARWTDEIGLKVLGVGLEILPEGKRSCFPHAHTHEEEFAYVLSGRPSVWINGHVFDLDAGMAVAFPPDTNISHCLLNNHSQEAVYFCLGETTEFKDEKIIYPLHPSRNEQCRRGGHLWENPPPVEMGSHDAWPDLKPGQHLALRVVSVEAAEKVFSIYNQSLDYFKKVDGCLPTLEMARKNILESPKKTIETYYKEFCLIELNQEPVGVVDLHKDHPDKDGTYLGLLMIVDKKKSQGFGRQCYNLIEDYIKRNYASQKIRLGVSDDNDISGFWKKMGFALNGHSYQWSGKEKTTTVTEYEKTLT